MAENNPTKLQKSDSSVQSVFVYTGAGCSVPKDVVRVQFDPSVVQVADHAFLHCKNLNEVVLNAGLKKIKVGAFQSCTSLQSITFPSSFTEIGRYAFYDCKNLRELVLNDGLQKIREYAFGNCKSLESITLPSSITEICHQAFSNCEKLSDVVLHEGITSIGGNAFRRCGSLDVFKFPTLSSRLGLIIQAGHWAELSNKVDRICGDAVQRRNEELFVPAVAMEDGNNWEIRETLCKIEQLVLFVPAVAVDNGRNWGSIRNILCKIERLVSYYEMKEATSIFELALWKSKLDQAGSYVANRNEYCIEVPGPVKETILEYFYS
jgi:hypothetical protein